MRRYGEYEQENKALRKRKRKQAMQRKIIGFCLFTFLLGVLCGRIVFAKDVEEEPAQSLAENTESIEYGLEESWQGQEASEMAIAGSMISAGREAEEEEEEDWKLTLVNKWNPMEDGYKPAVAEIENNYYFDARAVGALQEMLADGRREGLDFWVCSAYRTIEKQTDLFEDKVRRVMAETGLTGEAAREEAGTEVAYPGTSEHNLGLAVDIVARDYQILDEKQARTAEAQWLKENCWRYGFILRYPTDKTEETGIIFEPWHYRYVGEKAAKEIMEQGICLEEYLDAVERNI
ncbi:D-alanyl-D-alanine carboxypeptidase family protein [bacterium 1XD21-13]|nr:D-alanyl-D-alanine carboxypeptidase family protein [bacterium 1XD21-13]